MKTRYLLSISIAIFFISTGCSEKDHLVTISTKYGDMKAVLFDETPQHKESFLELAKEGRYDSTIFHRVIQGFMIQGGDINQKPNNSEPVNTLIPAEFRDHLIHSRGMLAGARTGDNVNPDKKSGTQFYIVQGQLFSREALEQQIEDQYYSQLVARLNQIFQNGEHRDLLDSLIELQKQNDRDAMKELVYKSLPVIENEFGKIQKKTYTDEQFKVYETIGGAPHLDWQYTVFGEVIDGLEIIDLIAGEAVTQSFQPMEDIYLTVSVEKMPKSKISKLYDYTYPSE